MALSMLVLLAWSAILPKPQLIDNKAVATNKPFLQAPASAVQTLFKSPKDTLLNRLTKIDRDKWEIIFNEDQAAIQEAIFKNFQNYKFSLQYGLILAGREFLFQRVPSKHPDEIKFVYRDAQQQITKSFYVSNSNYTIELEIEFSNLSGLPMSVNAPLVLGVLNFSMPRNQMNLQSVGITNKEKTVHSNGRKDFTSQDIKFLSLRERYFCAIIEPTSSNYSAFIKKINSQESEVGLIPQESQLLPGQSIKQKFHIYMGPQDLQSISTINPAWSELINFGAFDFISRIVLRILELIYRLVHNWGTAIIILSALVYLALYPLSIKQMRSMKEMQLLQPRIDELRKTHKDNPQKLNKEIMELYREHKVNPLGGCLPLLMQIPIFFALYQALIRFVSLKGARFLWIKDLSEPDRLFLLPVSLPILGNEINILPILMAIGMFIQQKASLRTGSVGEQQKMMLVLMPLMFGFIFYHMSSGFVLYWFVNSTLMLLFQLRMNRVK